MSISRWRVAGSFKAAAAAWARRSTTGLGVPAGAQTSYRWASISKPLTAVVALQLAAEGALGLERSDLEGRYYRLPLMTAAGGPPVLTVPALAWPCQPGRP